MRQTITFLLFLSFLFSACTKKDITIEQTYDDQIVDDNIAPPYSGVTTVQIQNYLNKIFIDLLGREPSQQELEDMTNFLRSNDLMDASKDALISDLMNTEGYYNRLWEIYSGNLLEGFTRAAVNENVLLYQYLYDLAIQMGNTLEAQFYQVLLNRETDLQQAVPQYFNSEITINEFLARMVNNDTYDEINMGSTNFAIACFENLFKRSPTQAELQNSVEMVEGFPAQLLLKDGSSKSDFIGILTSVPEFYQGLAFDAYQQLLARTPTSPEMSAATMQLLETVDYQAFQRSIMLTEEYAGF